MMNALLVDELPSSYSLYVVISKIWADWSLLSINWSIWF